MVNYGLNINWYTSFSWNFCAKIYFKGPPSALRQFLTTEGSIKIMKDGFYFMLKALFVHEIFKFLSWLFGYTENSLIRWLSLILKFMTSQTRQQVYKTHIAEYFKK